jgi:hypothetical protein
MRSAPFQMMLARQRVLLAVYWLSDGLLCTATNDEIAAAAGRTARTVREHLQDLDYEGLVLNLGRPREYHPRRLLVLMDHQLAGYFVSVHQPGRRFPPDERYWFPEPGLESEPAPLEAPGT